MAIIHARVRSFPLGNMRNIIFWVFLFFVLVALFRLFSGDASSGGATPQNYSEFVTAVQSGAVTSATIDGETVRYRVGTDTFTTVVPADAGVTQLLVEQGVAVEAKPQETSGFTSLLLSLLPVLLLVGVWIYFMNRMQGGGRGGAMGFGDIDALILSDGPWR